MFIPRPRKSTSTNKSAYKKNSQSKPQYKPITPLKISQLISSWFERIAENLTKFTIHLPVDSHITVECRWQRRSSRIIIPSKTTTSPKASKRVCSKRRNLPNKLKELISSTKYTAKMYSYKPKSLPT